MAELGIVITIILDVAIFSLIYLIISLALNLQYGYVGIPNFGIVISVEIGAFIPCVITRLICMFYSIDSNLNFITDNWSIVSLINSRLYNNPLEAMLVFGLSVIGALLAGVAIGFIATYPVIRLKTDYLLMALIAMSEGVRIIGIYYEPIAGGTAGMAVLDPFCWLGKVRHIGLTLVYLAITVLLFLLLKKMTNSPFGRLLRATRDNETTAISIGKNIVNIKKITMILGSMLASLAGNLFSFYCGATIPSAYTRSDWTFWPWLMVLIGGIGNNTGATCGTIFIIFIRRILIIAKHSFAPFIPFDIVYLENILLGMALIAIIGFKPKGIFPEKPTRTIDVHKRRK